MSLEVGMTKAKIYHNPRCSKSRQTLSLLRERDLEVAVVDYLKNPPTADELELFCQRLGKRPLELMRVKEKKFSELGLSTTDKRSAREWLEIMSEHPILIERPIVVCKDRVAVGRPPERVLKIL